MQVPKLLLQPVPQWPLVVPHQPYCEQQVPKDEPAHVKPEVPAQVPSVETLTVEVGALVEVDEARVEVDEVRVEVVEVRTEELVEPEPVQVPKPDWQPVPQYAVVEPHHPAGLQQLPKVLPWQVKPEAPPQVPSVETVPLGVAALVDVDEVRVEVDEARVEVEEVRTEEEDDVVPEEPQVPKADWHPVEQ